MDSVAKNDAFVNQQIDLTINFPWGIPGLDYNEFILFVPTSDLPFYFLRSTVQPEIGLLLINPFVLFSDYEFELDDEVTGKLKITDEKQVAILCTVNTSRGVESATVNLMAPIVINTEKMMAKQVVLKSGRFSIRTPLPFQRRPEKEAP